MNRIRLIIVIFITIILQSTIISGIRIAGVSPSLAIPVVVALSMGFGSVTGAYAGLVLGLLEDVLFSQVLGFRALLYFIIGLVIGNVEYRFNPKDYKTGLFITAVATIFQFFMFTMAAIITNQEFQWLVYLKGPLFIEMGLNMLFFYVTMKIYQKIFIFPNIRFF